ncbi:MAG: arylsulfatase [Verrucomicrobiota bacterium]
MNKFIKFGIVLICLGYILKDSHAATTKPNIIIILVDDMGFSDIGCYGSEIPTPNIDRLANEGLKFTQFYNNGRCCPSRASLVSGLYAHEVGVGHMIDVQDSPGYLGRLNDNCVTLGEVMHTAGYYTAMVGKWHLGQEHGVVPWKRGFDRTFNSPDGGFYSSHSPRAELYLDGKKLSNKDPLLGDNWYTTDLWTDFSIRFIDDALVNKKPFLLYLAHNAPHFPLQAPEVDIAQFRGKYSLGWDKLRSQRYANEIKLGVINERWPLSPRSTNVKSWDSLSISEQLRFQEIMAVYAACVSHMDKAIGRLITALKERKLYDNTLILFMSDNGGNAEAGPNGQADGKIIGNADSYVRCGESWANLENTPFRLYKHFNHEGGVSTPLIAHWPLGIKSHGELRLEPGHLIDIMPTCVEISGAHYPQSYKGNLILPMEGKSLMAAFKNEPFEREAIYWEHEGNAAVRVGDWKLVRYHRDGDWELYNMKVDRTELNNLSYTEPQRVKDLEKLWTAWAYRTHVLPYPAGKKF